MAEYPGSFTTQQISDQALDDCNQVAANTAKIRSPDGVLGAALIVGCCFHYREHSEATFE